jgi:hypothetical protein
VDGNVHGIDEPTESALPMSLTCWASTSTDWPLPWLRTNSPTTSTLAPVPTLPNQPQNASLMSETTKISSELKGVQSNRNVVL